MVAKIRYSKTKKTKINDKEIEYCLGLTFVLSQ